MIRTCVRLFAGILLLGVLAIQARAQTVETLTGQGRFVDIPGETLGFSIDILAVAPDGFVYFTDYNQRLVRLNPATGTVTALPATPGGFNFPVSYAGLAFDAAGNLYTRIGGELVRIDTNTWAVTPVGEFYYGGPMAFHPNGNLYFAPGDTHVYVRLPSGEVSIIAGAGDEPGFSGDGGPAIAAQLSYLKDLKIGPDGDIYVADSDNNRIRRISLSTGIITTVAGTGLAEPGGDGLPATETNIPMPMSLALDAAGNLYVGGLGDFRIRRIDAVTGIVSTFAGTGVYEMSGDGGPATAAGVRVPQDFAFDSGGNFFFSDSSQYHRYIRRIDAATGVVTRLAGMEHQWLCGENVPPHYGCHTDATALDVDAAGNFLFSDPRRVRMISAATNRLTTLAQAPEAWITGLGHDAEGNWYFTTSFRHQVIKVDAASGETSVFAGQTYAGYGGDGGPATAATLENPGDIAFDAAGNAYITDGFRRIRKVDAATGIITTFAGDPRASSPGDGGPASAAGFSGIGTLAFDPAGRLVLLDSCAFRRIDLTTGIITRIGGQPGCAPLYSGDGGPALDARFPQIRAWAMDPVGNIFLAWDTNLRRIDAASGLVTTVPSPAGGFVSPEGLQLRLPNKLAFDAAGRLYWSTPFPGHIFRISGLSDPSPPVITPNVSGTAGSGGWYRSDVTITWTVADAESSVSSSSGCSPGSVTSDTAGETFTCTATSSGGTASHSVTIRRDSTPPLIELTTPPAGASYATNAVVASQYACSDALSGVASCTGSVPNGSPVPTQTAGSQTFQVQATDAAGNIASLSRSYTVSAPVPAFTFERFTELRRSPTHNGVVAGSLVPIRWRLVDSSGAAVTNPAAFQSLTILPLTCQAPPEPFYGVATGDPGLSVDAVTGVFTYNWQTDASWTGCRRVQLRFSNNLMREIVFRFQ